MTAEEYKAKMKSGGYRHGTGTPSNIDKIREGEYKHGTGTPMVNDLVSFILGGLPNVDMPKGHTLQQLLLGLPSFETEMERKGINLDGKTIGGAHDSINRAIEENTMQDLIKTLMIGEAEGIYQGGNTNQDFFELMNQGEGQGLKDAYNQSLEGLMNQQYITSPDSTKSYYGGGGVSPSLPAKNTLSFQNPKVLSILQRHVSDLMLPDRITRNRVNGQFKS